MKSILESKKDSEIKEYAAATQPEKYNNLLEKETIWKLAKEQDKDFSLYLKDCFQSHGVEYNQEIQVREIKNIHFLNRILFGEDPDNKKNQENFHDFYQKNHNELTKFVLLIDKDIKKYSKDLIFKLDETKKPYEEISDEIRKKFDLGFKELQDKVKNYPGIETETQKEYIKKSFFQEVLFQKTKKYLLEIYKINDINRDEIIPLEIKKIKNLAEKLRFENESSTINYCLQGIKDIISMPKIIADPFGGDHIFRRQIRMILEQDFSDIVFVNAEKGNKYSLDDYLNSDNRIKGNMGENLPREIQYWLSLDQTINDQTNYQKYLKQLAIVVDNIFLIYEIDIVQEEIVKFFTTKEKPDRLDNIDKIIRYLTATPQIKKFSQNNLFQINEIVGLINNKCEIKEGVISNINFNNPLVSKEIRNNAENVDFIKIEEKMHNLYQAINKYIKTINDPSINTLEFEVPSHHGENLQVEQENYSKFIKNISQKFSPDLLTDKKIKYVLLYDYVLIKLVKFLYEQQNQPASQKLDSEKLAA